ncbi:Hsp20/alpha crystallin family protein [Amycolatopsis australiensis]|uniref:HSP20 family protein n=1 Tax=Amycolatopsis australiensis TaxID=546364 RepID=A0A1K1SRL1_9PSEU|nr:Hsp20/alpha crystallin family protein [Amycolatopsis australiensis]SFW86938.1 HSP20 family protein [Amycolatopsis australiensis]
MTLTTVRSVSALRTGRWSPGAGVRETDDAYLVEVELPGVKRRDVTVEVTGNEVAVQGKAGRRDLFRLRSRRTDEFSYRVTLPDEVDSGAASAALTKGVLTVRVPKREFARRRRIPVHSA